MFPTVSISGISGIPWAPNVRDPSSNSPSAPAAASPPQAPKTPAPSSPAPPTPPQTTSEATASPAACPTSQPSRPPQSSPVWEAMRRAHTNIDKKHLSFKRVFRKRCKLLIDYQSCHVSSIIGGSFGRVSRLTCVGSIGRPIKGEIGS